MDRQLDECSRDPRHDSTLYGKLVNHRSGFTHQWGKKKIWFLVWGHFGYLYGKKLKDLYATS